MNFSLHRYPIPTFHISWQTGTITVQKKVKVITEKVLSITKLMLLESPKQVDIIDHHVVRNCWRKESVLLHAKVNGYQLCIKLRQYHNK